MISFDTYYNIKRHIAVKKLHEQGSGRPLFFTVVGSHFFFDEVTDVTQDTNGR